MSLRGGTQYVAINLWELELTPPEAIPASYEIASGGILVVLGAP